MTLIKPFDQDNAGDESLLVAEKLLEEAGIVLGRLLGKARREDPDAAGKAKAAIAELSAGWKMAVLERNRVADERRKAVGVVGTYAIDFDAARAEIGRRLACLRDAGEG